MSPNLQCFDKAMKQTKTHIGNGTAGIWNQKSNLKSFPNQLLYSFSGPFLLKHNPRASFTWILKVFHSLMFPLYQWIEESVTWLKVLSAWNYSFFLKHLWVWGRYPPLPLNCIERPSREGATESLMSRQLDHVTNTCVKIKFHQMQPGLRGDCMNTGWSLD